MATVAREITRASGPSARQLPAAALGWGRRWSTPLRVAAAAVGLALLLRSANPVALVHVLAGARPGWVVAAVLTGVLTQMGAALPWGMLLPSDRRLGWGRIGCSFLRATFASSVLPTGVGGDALRTAEVGRVVGYGRAISALTGSRVLGLLAMAVIATVAAGMLAHSDGPLVPIASAAVLAAILVLAVLAFGADHLVGRGPLRRAPHRLRTLLQDAATGLREYRARPGHLALVFGASLAVWSLNLVSMVLFARALGTGVSWTVFAVAMPMTLAVTLLPVTVNGFGVREGLLVGLLARAGVGAASATAVAMFADLQVLPVALAGAALSIGWRRTASQQVPSNR